MAIVGFYHRDKFDDYSHLCKYKNSVNAALKFLADKTKIPQTEMEITFDHAKCPKLDLFKRIRRFSPSDEFDWSQFLEEEEALEEELHKYKQETELKRSSGDNEAIKVHFYGDYFCYYSKDKKIKVYDPIDSTICKKDLDDLEQNDIVFFTDSCDSDYVRNLNAQWEDKNNLAPNTCLKSAYEWKVMFTQIYKKCETEHDIPRMFNELGFYDLIEFDSMKKWCEDSDSFDYHYIPTGTVCPRVKDQNTRQISSDDSKVQKLLSCIEKISEKKFSLPIDRFHSALKTINSNRSKASRYIDKVIEEKLMNRGGQDTSLASVNYKSSIILSGKVENTNDKMERKC